MIGWGIALAAVLIIAFTRVGVKAAYRADGFTLIIKLGFIRIRLFPSKKKAAEKPPKKQRKEKRQKKKKEPEEKKTAFGLGFGDILDLLGILKKNAGRLTRSVRIDLLELDFTLGGDDPCDLAMFYGRVNMLIGIALPILRQGFRLKKENISVAIDFDRAQSLYYGALSVTASIGRMIVVSLVLFGSLLRWYLKRRGEKKEDEGQPGNTNKAGNGEPLDAKMKTDR